MFGLILAASMSIFPQGDGDAGSFWCQQEVKELATQVEGLRDRLSPQRYENLQDWLYVANSQCSHRVHDAQQTMRMVKEMVVADLRTRQR